MLHPIHFRQYIRIMESLGFPPSETLADTGISLDAIADPDYQISLDNYLRLFKNMGRFGDLSGLGLDIGLRSDPADGGILGQATLACQSLRQAIEEVWSPYGRKLGMIAALNIIDDGPEFAAIEIEIPFMGVSSRRVVAESILCRIAKHGAWVAGNAPLFQQIRFSFPAPQYHRRYAELFNCPIGYNAERARATVYRSWLERPLKTRNDALLASCRSTLMEIDQRLQSTTSIADRVKELLLLWEDAALPSREAVAHELGLGLRTLTRALGKHRVSYRSLVEQVRFERALMSVESNRVLTKEIAYHAGYRDVNAFRRAFKKWTNQTVRDYYVPPQSANSA